MFVADCECDVDAVWAFGALSSEFCLLKMREEGGGADGVNSGARISWGC